MFYDFWDAHTVCDSKNTFIVPPTYLYSINRKPVQGLYWTGYFRTTGKLSADSGMFSLLFTECVFSTRPLFTGLKYFLIITSLANVYTTVNKYSTSFLTGSCWPPNSSGNAYKR